MNEDRRQQHIERLERRREQVNRRLDDARDRINARFDREAAEQGRKLNPKQEEIVEAALAQLHIQGLNDLSLREIAKRLDMQAPAIYWHFKSKAVLVDFMAEAILDKKFANLTARSPDEPWQDWLIQTMSDLRAAMLAYPDGGRVVAGAHFYPAVTLGKLFDKELESLHTAGVDLGRARLVLGAATYYTFGFVIEEQSAPTPEQIAAQNLDELFAPYPYIAKAMQEVNFLDEDDDLQFRTGLEYIIRGASGSGA